MERAKIGKKGQLTIPRSALHIELYTEARVREFEETNTIPAAMERRVEAHPKKKRAKR